MCMKSTQELLIQIIYTVLYSSCCCSCVAVAIISCDQTAWSFCNYRIFSVSVDSLLVCWWTYVLANPTNICRHTWTVVCGDRYRSFWLCAYGPSCFAPVREHKAHFLGLSLYFLDQSLGWRCVNAIIKLVNLNTHFSCHLRCPFLSSLFEWST